MVALRASIAVEGKRSRQMGRANPLQRDIRRIAPPVAFGSFLHSHGSVEMTWRFQKVQSPSAPSLRTLRINVLARGRPPLFAPATCGNDMGT